MMFLTALAESDGLLNNSRSRCVYEALRTEEVIFIIDCRLLSIVSFGRVFGSGDEH